MSELTAINRSPESGFKQDPLGEQLVAEGKLSAAELKRVIALPHKGADSLPIQLVRLGLVAEADVASLLANLTGLTLLDSTEYPDIAVSSTNISPRYMKSVFAIPIDESDTEIRLAMADPRASHVIRAIAVASDKQISPCLGLQSDIERAIDRCYGDGRSEMGKLSSNDDNNDENELDVEQLRDMASEAPVIRVVNHMIQQAVDLRASDIHIEPFVDRLIVRLRVDGVLREVESPPPRMTAAVISRIKIMSKLNIAERRLPQDGRIMLKLRGKEIDFRISTVPTLHGESVVMRLLDKKGIPLDFKPLGFLPEQEQQIKDILNMPNGIVLVTGPTGSGKTTTLYAALNHMNSTERKILTVEDPVEYQLQGINQIHVKSKIGLDFPSALRSILRQDPDIIMIGEMRDLETARIAVQSALTGHLVLSTLHTNDSGSAVTRLLDMGIEDYLLTSTVNAIIAQRLVRTLCSHCRTAISPDAEILPELQRLTDETDISLYRPNGCSHCDNTGFQGRTAVIEILTITDAIRKLVLSHAEAGEIQKVARQQGMFNMYEDGLRKAMAGYTTLDEILRLTQEL